MNGTVRLVPSVPDAFAQLVVEALAEPRADRFSLFLSGGATAQECYRRLAQVAGPGSGVGWGEVDVYLGDERCVPPTTPTRTTPWWPRHSSTWSAQWVRTIPCTARGPRRRPPPTTRR